MTEPFPYLDGVRAHVETFHQLHDGTPIRVLCTCPIGTDHVTRPTGTPPKRRAPARPIGPFPSAREPRSR